MNRRSLFGIVTGGVVLALSSLLPTSKQEDAPLQADVTTNVQNTHVTLTQPLVININGIEAEEFISELTETIRQSFLTG